MIWVAEELGAISDVFPNWSVVSWMTNDSECETGKVLISNCESVAEKKGTPKASVSSFGGGIWLDFVSCPCRNTIYTKPQNSAHVSTK